MTRGTIRAAAASAVLLGATAATATAMPPMHMAREAAAPARTVTALHRSVVRVAIHGFAFQPARLIVSRGTRIVWVNRDADPHTVKTAAAPRAGGWSSEALDTGDSYGHVVGRAGTFSYICTIHPFMHATVVVRP